jgi:ATP-binding cassette subfamily F protein uup
VQTASVAPPALPKVTISDAPKKAAKVKMTWAEEKELDGIMDAIGQAEDNVYALEAELARPENFTDDGTMARTLTAKLDAAKKEAERLTARWEELEAKRTAAKA